MRIVFSVPLLNPVNAVISRLSVASTRALDPVGAATEGYDDVFREPVAYENPSGDVVDARQYAAAVLVPCQFETWTYEERVQTFGGNAPDTEVVLILHRRDLRRRSLIDANGDCVLKAGDKVTELRQGPTRKVLTFPAGGVYIYKVVPASEGMGPDGYDLHLIGLHSRPHRVP